MRNLPSTMSSLSEHLSEKSAAAADPYPPVVAHLIAMVPRTMKPAVIHAFAAGRTLVDVLGAGRRSETLGAVPRGFLALHRRFVREETLLFHVCRVVSRRR